jgi:methylase of polypeptide subunit release factors
MKEFILDNGKVIYDEIYDGGGTTFGVNSLKDDKVKSVIKKGDILEMCSGPGFMGFYLNFEGLAESLVLSDINDVHSSYIEQTCLQNNLLNTKFIQSNGFESFDSYHKFDTIVMNAPHYSSPRNGGYISKEEELICLDQDLTFHRHFFKYAKNHLKYNGVIILIGNMGGIKPEEIVNMAGSEYMCNLIACERYGWIRDSRFYVLKITKANAD